MCIITPVAEMCTAQTKRQGHGSIAQLGEHLPYKQEVTGSSPVVPTINGLVVQSVSTPACHAGGRRFESVPGRQNKRHHPMDDVFCFDVCCKNYPVDNCSKHADAYLIGDLERTRTVDLQRDRLAC